LERQLGRAKSLPSLGSNGKGTKWHMSLVVGSGTSLI
jgi:hypothetical protein